MSLIIATRTMMVGDAYCAGEYRPKVAYRKTTTVERGGKKYLIGWVGDPVYGERFARFFADDDCEAGDPQTLICSVWRDVVYDTDNKRDPHAGGSDIMVVVDGRIFVGGEGGFVLEVNEPYHAIGFSSAVFFALGYLDGVCNTYQSKIIHTRHEVQQDELYDAISFASRVTDYVVAQYDWVERA